MKNDTDTIEINLAKTHASSEKYFALFDKYIANTYNENSTILLYDICNEGCIELIVNKNPMATYVVYDCQEMKDILPALIPGVKFIFVNNSEVDKLFEYNLFGMKFDCIIMNPPYQRNLHLKILEKAIEHLKDDDSVCVNLSPVRWLQDPLAKYKKRNDYHRFENNISKHIINIETIDTNTAREQFHAELLQPLGLYVCNNTDTNTVYKNKYKVHPFIDRVLKRIIQDNNFEKHVKQPYNDNLKNFVLINIMAPPMKYGKPMFDALKTWCGYFQNGKNQNNLTYREAKAKNTRATRGSINQDQAIVFKTPSESKNCYDSMQTMFVRFFVMTSVVDVHVHQNVLPWMDDYTEPWTDERFYSFFNITPDEQKIIEETMENYK